MKPSVWTAATAGAIAGAEVSQVTPEVVGGALVELLAGIQYAKLVGGLGRDELYLDLLKPVSERPTPVILFVLESGWALVEPKRVLPQPIPLAEAGYAIPAVDIVEMGKHGFLILKPTSRRQFAACGPTRIFATSTPEISASWATRRAGTSP